MGNSFFWDSRRHEYTIQSTSVPSQWLIVLPQAITALPRWCRPTLLLSSLLINLPLTHLIHCVILLPWVSRWLNYITGCLHNAPINHFITDSTFTLPLLQSTSHSKQDVPASQPPPGSSSLLSSPLQHQANYLHANYKTIQQFTQHLKADRFDWKTLLLIALQFQKDFALLRYLLSSPVETISTKNIAVKNSATSPLPIPNPNANSSAFPLPSTSESPFPCSTSVGAVGSPRAKTSNPENANFLSSSRTVETHSTMAQNLTSRISKLQKLFQYEIATYTSITARIHFQNFSLYDKIPQLEPGNSDAIIWKIPSVKFVFDSAKVAQPSSDPQIEPATRFSSPIFRTHPHGYNFFVEVYTYGIGPATGKCASLLFTLFPDDYDKLLQWPFSKIIHIGIRDQLDPLNIWTKTIQPDHDPAYKKPTISTKTGIATIKINNFIPHSKLFSETEGFLIDHWWCELYRNQFFRPFCAKASHPNFPPCPLSIEPLNHFHFPFIGVSYRVTHNA